MIFLADYTLSRLPLLFELDDDGYTAAKYLQKGIFLSGFPRIELEHTLVCQVHAVDATFTS